MPTSYPGHSLLTEDEGVLLGEDDCTCSRLGKYFKIEYEKFSECFIFLNSGGVCSKTFYIPLNHLLLNSFNFIDNFLTKFFPKFFAMGRRLVLKKV